MIEEVTKTCFKCGRTLPLSEFYTHPQMGDGHLNKCIECTKRDVAEHKKSNPEKELEMRLNACAKKPTQRNAHRVVEAALVTGRLVKPSVCSGCGCPDTEHRMEAHHHDYSRPLDVIWLCTVCHSKMDQQRRIREGCKAHAIAKPVVKKKDGVKVGWYESIADAARDVGVKPNSISQCLSGKSKTSAGFEWAYADDGAE